MRSRPAINLETWSCVQSASKSFLSFFILFNETKKINATPLSAKTFALLSQSCAVSSANTALTNQIKSNAIAHSTLLFFFFYFFLMFIFVFCIFAVVLSLVGLVGLILLLETKNLC